MGQNGSMTNGNEGVLHTLKITGTESSPSDAVSFHTQNIPFLVGGYYFL